MPKKYQSIIFRLIIYFSDVFFRIYTQLWNFRKTCYNLFYLVFNFKKFFRYCYLTFLLNFFGHFRHTFTHSAVEILKALSAYQWHPMCLLLHSFEDLYIRMCEVFTSVYQSHLMGLLFHTFFQQSVESWKSLPHFLKAYHSRKKLNKQSSIPSWHSVRQSFLQPRLECFSLVISAYLFSKFNQSKSMSTDTWLEAWRHHQHLSCANLFLRCVV